MRLDKFLKLSRIIKRRTVANQVCDGGRVKVNGKSAKPAHTLKEGDIITIAFGDREISARVLSVDEKLARKDPKALYEGAELD
ncbi:MAG: RNA-binding S4 domain-containing protein [Clostridiales bacterium]|jgi:ribosomal 50S subunit-recycling heat shock protein|nr:RNA-binding S4 domain-containing protein [Clostridiales bacterium]